MYLPRHFELSDKSIAFQLIEEIVFGQLISYHQGNIECNFAPFYLDAKNNYLSTHLAKKNIHTSQILEAQDLKIIFQGPHTYISPGWFSDPQNVPTWNYIAIEVEATPSIMDKAELVDLLEKLSSKHEAQFENPWTMDKLSPKKLDAMTRAIEGFKFKIKSLTAKAKLSQNKSHDQVRELIAGLKKQPGDNASLVKNWMQQINDIKD
ncbi:MAG: FMN-binding negative transcriptional regulator [Kangiellaceae bacterium]|nr:FMN-binding negative transcriptional regulator [Kangiellaceae bacterium]MCW9000593.1 FMN-binding negative transcriptional regulator [Kangiellaceae bacterium]MCW9015949.1 FMN-binding negative transcriptional regulator [Kangiellaceae bacterium]